MPLRFAQTLSLRQLRVFNGPCLAQPRVFETLIQAILLCLVHPAGQPAQAMALSLVARPYLLDSEIKLSRQTAQFLTLNTCRRRQPCSLRQLHRLASIPAAFAPVSDVSASLFKKNTITRGLKKPPPMIRYLTTVPDSKAQSKRNDDETWGARLKRLATTYGPLALGTLSASCAKAQSAHNRRISSGCRSSTRCLQCFDLIR